MNRSVTQWSRRAGALSQGARVTLLKIAGAFIKGVRVPLFKAHNVPILKARGCSYSRRPDALIKGARVPLLNAHGCHY